jgi:hypothetical protein
MEVETFVLLVSGILLLGGVVEVIISFKNK